MSLAAMDRTRLLAVLSVVLGIASFSAMDATIKGAALVAGVYTALLGRNLAGTVLTVPLWLLAGKPLPGREALRVHALRSALTAAMAALFFYGLVRIPLAEGIAVSFVAPLAALFFAAVLLKERIRPRAVGAAILGLAGVAVIASGRLGSGRMDAEAAAGTGAILLSALLYAVNIVLQRRQALLAGPVEIALFQNLFVALVLLPFAPWLAALPPEPVLAGVIGWVVAGAVLATLALLLLAWGYARAEAQVLVPVEYTGFVWAALFGWLFFAEPVDGWTLAGAAVIVAACIMAQTGPGGRPAETEQTKV